MSSDDWDAVGEVGGLEDVSSTVPGAWYEIHTIVAVAVMAVKATELPITAQVIAMLSPVTRNAALTGILFLFSLRKYLENGKTPSLEIAKVTRCADMKQDAVAQVESTQRMLRMATAPLGPIVCTRYSAQLLE
jgi:hypothetical protein